MLRLKILGAVLAMGTVGYGVDQYHKHTAFDIVDARVQRVTATCKMEKKEGRTTYFSKFIDCDAARIAVRSDPEWLHYHIIQKSEINFYYVSPVDRRSHEGSWTLNADGSAQQVRPGDTIKIRASKTDPLGTREL